MVFVCLYSLNIDFPNGLDNGQISNEIILQFPTFLQIQVSDNTVYILFSTDQSGNKAILDGIVTAHNPATGIDPVKNIAAVVSKRTSGSGPNAGGFSNMLFDQKKFENLITVVEYDTVNTERIKINEDGNYDISYTVTCKIARCQMRLVVDDTTVVAGSEQEAIPSGTGESIISCRIVVAINAGSYVTVQLHSPSPGTGELIAGAVFTIVSQKSLKGDQGPTGPQGASGNGSGDVMGGGVSTDNAIARWNGVTGTVVQDSSVLIDDNDNITGVSDIKCKTLDSHNETPGTDGHIRFRVADDYGSDTYAHGIDVTATNRVLSTIEEGIYRQAGLLGARSSNATSTVFGVTLSSDSGTTWDPCLILTQNCKVGICKASPTETLDVVGNIAVTGTVDGRDIASDGTAQDSHIADATLHRIINDAGTSATELWSASKIVTELTNQTHDAADITDFNTAADARITAQKGNANGLATLDGGGKVPASQLALSNVLYIGSWNADTNAPTITSGVGTQGHYYVVSVSGATTIDGFNDWQVGDWIIFNGTIWEQADHTDAVSSIAGKTGAVVLDTADIASGTFADARIAQSNVTQHEGAVTHQNLSGAGTNTHTQIDNHIALTNEHLDWTIDQGTSNIHDANIVASSVSQHEGSITIGNLIGAPTGVVVGISDIQTLSGKTLTLPKINDTSSNHTYNFAVSELVLDRTITLPLLNSNDTFVFASHTDTLNNKTLTSTSNDVAAKSLHSATTIVDVVSATAPTSGQILTAISGTAATWQTPAASTISETTVSSIVSTSTTSITYIIINSMTITPAAGTYFVSFTASASRKKNNNNAYYAIYSADSKVSYSEKNFGWCFGGPSNNFSMSIHTQAVVTVNGSQSIDVRYYDEGNGIFKIYERSMTILKLS